MRDNTKWIMLITAAAFVALMVFEWGMDASGQSGAQLSGGNLGEVNGETITYEEYNQVYRNLYDQRAAQSDAPISSTDNREIEDAAWEQIVTNHLLHQEMQERDIGASAAEIRQAARFSPPPQLRQNEMFQTDGQFDIEKYQQFLSQSAGNNELMLQLESYYRDVIPRNKLYQQILAGMHLSDQELWQMWRDRNETARVRYAAVDPDVVVSDDEIAAVTDDEIEAYYRAHREEFRRPAEADVRVVGLDKAPTAADTTAARERTEELRRQILDGADFAEVARRESEDPGSASQGGSLGTVGPGEMVPAFDQAVWSLPAGQLSEPVLTRFGYHLIEVESRTGEEQAEVRHILVPIDRGNTSELELLERADSLEDLGERMTLEAAAAEFGLRVRSAVLTRETPSVAGIGPLEEGIDWAFDRAEPDEVSPVFESDNAFYMLEFIDFTPEHIPDLEDVEQTIRGRLVREKKMERARGIVSDLVDRVRDGQSLEAAAAAAGLQTREAGPFTRLDFVPGLGQGSAPIGAAFGLEPGETSGAVEANEQLYVLQTLERTPADREAWEEQKETQRIRAQQALQQQRIQQFIAGLREDAEIVDNRDEVLRPADEDQEQQNPMAPPMAF